MRRFILLAALVLLTALPVAGQGDHPATTRGFTADQTFTLSDIDTVDLLSGNVTHRIAIGHEYPVGGAIGSYGFRAMSTSKAWFFEEFPDDNGGAIPDVRSSPHPDSNAGFGWIFTLGKLIPPEDPTNESPFWVYLDNNAARHVLYPRLHNNDTFENPDPPTYETNYTLDSTYLRMRALSGGEHRIQFGNGVDHIFDNQNRLRRIEDPHGNFINITYPNSLTWNITDSQGRVQQVLLANRITDGQNVPVVSQLILTAFAGTTATYTFNYSQQLIRPACSDTDRGSTALIEVPLLTSVTLPDGTAYSMNYETQALPDTCSWGLIENLTVPTGGTYAYTYTDWTLPTNGCSEIGESLPWAQRTPGIGSRKLVQPGQKPDDVTPWTYIPDLLDPPAERVFPCRFGELENPAQTRVTTVRTPSGHESLHYFSVWPNEINSPEGPTLREYGLPFDRTQADDTGNRFLSSQVFDCSGACTLMRETFVRYEYESPCLSASPGINCEDSNRRLASQRTVYHDDSDMQGNPRYIDVDFSDFDGLGHYRTSTTSSNFAGSTTRSTTTIYNDGRDLVLSGSAPTGSYPMIHPDDPWILETFTETSQGESGNTAVTRFCFDDDGFMTRQRTMVASAPTDDDVLVVYTHDGLGNLSTEQYYGGDVQAIDASSTTDLCDIPLPGGTRYSFGYTYQFGALASVAYTRDSGADFDFRLLDLTIDANTGRAASSRTPSLFRTDFTYDSLGRRTGELPQNNLGGDLVTTYTPVSSTNPAKVLFQRTRGSAVLAEEEFVLEGFGRVTNHRRNMPGTGWAVKDTEFDDQGRQTRVSEWADEDSSTRHWTEFLDYDPFDRPKAIRPPDGEEHDITITYRGDRVIKRTTSIATSWDDASSTIVEEDVETIERRDPHGRLYQIVEPSASDGSDITTTFTYDVGNHLALVSARDPVTSILQTRSFVYDNRGFQLSQTHPESGTITFQTFDPLGNPRLRNHGPSRVRFLYDRAARVTEIQERDGLQRALKEFVYATTNNDVGGIRNRRKSKMVTARRHHYFDFAVPNPSSPGIFADGFECGHLGSWSSVTGGTPGPGPCLTGSSRVTVEESFTYTGRQGQLSARSTVLDIDGNRDLQFAQGWTYNDLGRKATITYPNCTFATCQDAGADIERTITNNYTRNFLTGVTGYATSITYHPNGLFNQITHANGINYTQALDPFGIRRPLGFQAAQGINTRWNSGAYQYDGTGNITQIGSGYYTYDKVSRLVSATVANDRFGGGVLRTQSYTLDSFSGLQAILGNSADPGRSTPTSAANNRLTSGTYDNAGRLTSWNGNGYAYDEFDMMGSQSDGQSTWHNVYNAADQRIWRFNLHPGSLSSRFTLRGAHGRALRMYSAEGGSWQFERDYIYRQDRLIAAETQEGAHHYHLDHQGTPRWVSGPAGEEIAFHAYYPYGEELSDTASADPERMRFTGHERDLGDLSSPADDLDYMMARYCNPQLGRFTTPDPFPLSRLRSPSTFNLYAYGNANPIKFTDPDGMQPEDEPDMIEEVKKLDKMIPVGDQQIPNVWYIDGEVTPATPSVGDMIKAAAAAILAAEILERIFGGDDESGESTDEDESGGEEPIGPDNDPDDNFFLSPGPFSGEGVPGRFERPTPTQRRLTNEQGEIHGCHSCGAKESGLAPGRWVNDHQPSRGLSDPNDEFNFYPHCLRCSNRQAQQVIREMKRRQAAAEKGDG